VGGALCPAGGVQRRPGGDTAIVGEILLAGVGEIGPPPLAGLAQHLPALALRPDQQLGAVGDERLGDVASRPSPPAPRLAVLARRVAVSQESGTAAGRRGRGP
jgi:hypothetical protein